MYAVGSAKRTEVLPDVPTVSESGYPGYEVSVWWGIAAPAGVPRSVRDRLRSEFTAILQDPETLKRLAAEAAEPRNVTPAEFRKIVHDDVKKWKEVARTAGIRVK